MIIDDVLVTLPKEARARREVHAGLFWGVAGTECSAGLALAQWDAHVPHGHSLIR